jgi:hypothetical protein
VGKEELQRAREDQSLTLIIRSRVTENRRKVPCGPLFQLTRCDLFTFVSINLTVREEIPLYSVNGSIAGRPLPRGNCVAKMNVGSQTGWYSIYEANDFQKFDPAPKVANIHLSVTRDGQVLVDA